MGCLTVRWVQYLAAIAGSLSALSNGLSVGWPSPSIPKLLADESEIFVSSEQATWIVTFSLISSAIFASLACYLSDVIGRKYTILLSVFPHFISAILIATASTVETLYAARITAGFGNSIATAIPAMYIAEIADIKIRGRLLGCFSVSFFTGILLAYITGSLLSIADQAIFFAMIPTLLLIVFTFMPETPYFHVMKNKHPEARKSLQILRQREDIEEELERIVTEVRREKNRKVSSINLLRHSGLRKALLTAVGLVLCEQMSGSIPVCMYSETIFKNAGVTFITPSTAAIGLQTCLLLSSFGSTFLTDRYGRRPLLLFSAACSAIALTLQSLYFFLLDVYNFDTTNYTWVPIIIMIFFIISYAYGLGSLPIAMSSEFFPMEYKKPAAVACITSLLVGSSLATLVFDLIRKSFGFHVTFSFFASLCVLIFIFIYNFVPETAKKSFDEIQQWFKMELTNPVQNIDLIEKNNLQKPS